jgi:hypothetical protein
MLEIGSMSPAHFSRLIIAPGTVLMNSLPKCASSSIVLAEGNLVLNSVAETGKESPIDFHRLCPNIKFMLYVPAIHFSFLYSNMSIIELHNRIVVGTGME